jgi:ubiquinone/menaquinone biosynthesis C-methylase UbiE
MGWFRKRAPSEPLAMTMTGMKLGDRLLVIGAGDPALIAALAAKAGLTGRACVIDADAARIERATAAIEREGALVEAIAAPWTAMPYESASFDIAVIRDVLASMADDERSRVLLEVFRVLRAGGRAIIIDQAPRGGIAGLIGGRTIDRSYAEGGAEAALSAVGFAATRVLAALEGMKFVEGAKRGDAAQGS